MMKALLSVCWLALGVVLLVLAEPCSAQIKLIPQSKLDSVANPRTVGEGKMTFKQGTTIDFHLLDEDAEPWTQVVEWQNRDSKPIVITHVKSSCSCLKAELERRSVAAGAVDRLKLTYYPKGHPGAVNQRLFIYTSLSADLPTAILNVKGVVRPSADHRKDYAYNRGELRLRQDTIYIERGRAEVVRVACMNSSSREMRLVGDTLLSSTGLKMWTEPKILTAGAEGDMVISISADSKPRPQAIRQNPQFGLSKGVAESANPALGAKSPAKADELLLYIRGLALPARERVVVIRYRD